MERDQSGLWGAGWDDLLARDASGLLIKRMHECVDGEYQAFRANDGAYLRKEFFGKYPELLKLVEHMSDDELWDLRRGGLDPVKVFNAYQRAMMTKGQPTVILAKTVKGYGLGEAAEGRMTAHQQKKLDRRRSDEDPRPVQSAAYRRERRAHRFLPPAGRFAGDEVSARSGIEAQGGPSARSAT